MSSIRNPVGPQSPRVYWRRRLLLLLGVIAVIVVIVLIVVRPGGGGPAAGDGRTPSPHSTTSGPGPGPSGSSGPAGSCSPSVVTLSPITDAASYPAGQQPQLSMSITNSGAKPCTLDVGTKAQVYVITSGSETIWTSSDCQTDPASDVRTLQPGKSLTTTPFAWDRSRSSKSTCTATSKTPVIAGGASYHLKVKVGDIASSGTKQFILQ